MGRSIAIVEDEPLIRANYVEALSRFGYSQALRLEPSSWQTHLKIAAELATVQSLGEAVDECRTALKLNETAQGHVLLGRILKLQGNLAGAEQEFAAARRLDPGQSPALDGAGGH